MTGVSSTALLLDHTVGELISHLPYRLKPGAFLDHRAPGGVVDGEVRPTATVSGPVVHHARRAKFAPRVPEVPASRLGFPRVRQIQRWHGPADLSTGIARPMIRDHQVGPH